MSSQHRLFESLERRICMSANPLDPAFNGGQLVTTQFSAGSSTISHVAVLGDGGVIAAGHVANTSETGFTSYQLALAKYHFDGTLDQSFGIGGQIVATPRGMTKGQDDEADPNGNLYVFGQNSAGTYLIIKFSGAGKIDTTFGKNGVLHLAAAGETNGFTLDASGRILVWGNRSISPALNHNSQEGVLRRYTSSGAIDPDFNGGNELIFLPPGTTETAGQTRTLSLNSVRVDSSGQIYASATDALYAPGGHSVDLIDNYTYRLTDSGATDHAFGSAGKVNTGSSIIGFLPNGQLMVFVGQHLSRLNSDGSVDFTYGTNGVTSFSTIDDIGAVAPDGSVIVTDRIINDHGGNDSSFAVQRVSPIGQLDTSFADSGMLTLTSSSDGDNGAIALATAPDGTIVVGGYTASSSPSGSQVENNNFALARLLEGQSPAVQLVPKTLRHDARYFSMSILIRAADGIDMSDLDDSDLKLVDSDGNSRKLRFEGSEDVNGDGKYIRATYRIIGPGSKAWSKASNGTYQVRLQHKQIFDSGGRTAEAGGLGTVRVKIA